MSKIDAILKIAKHGGNVIIKNLPTILTAVGTIGVGAAICFTAKKAPAAKVELDEAKQEWEETPDKEKRVKADYIFKLIRIGAKHYWIVIAVATGSIVCFWLANRIDIKRLRSALIAAGLSATAKEELEEKIKELDGDKHLQKLRDEIDGDRIKNNPPVEDQIIDTGYGMHLCYEPITGRYFYSNIERIKRAVLVCRDYLQKDGYVSLNDWFNEIDLDTTDLGNDLCWIADSLEDIKGFDISFSSQLTKESVPVLVIRYDTNPIMDRRDW